MLTEYKLNTAAMPEVAELIFLSRKDMSRCAVVNQLCAGLLTTCKKYFQYFNSQFNSWWTTEQVVQLPSPCFEISLAFPI